MDSSALTVSSKELIQNEGSPIARSSHAVAVVGAKAFVFGGEFEPRLPIDNKIHVFDIASGNWSVVHDANGDVPSPRVGVTIAPAADHGKIFVFAGRDEQHQELNEFYSYDIETSEWKLLSAEDTSPSHRSYHSMAIDAECENVYVFGGCGKDGRLNDLWVFNISSGAWKELPRSSASARGGPGLAVVNGAVWVVFGFDGQELADVHRFDLESQTWEVVDVGVGDDSPKPAGRSVFGIASVGGYVMIYGGEVDPSDLGHLGAGAFTDELLVLDTEKLVWRRPEFAVVEGRHPGARGWFASAAFGKSMLVYGGNSPTNDRLDDIYVLTWNDINSE